MGSYTAVACIVTALLITTLATQGVADNDQLSNGESRAPPASVITVDTNMPFKTQNEARDVLTTVYDQHIEENRCKQFALSFAQSHKSSKWVCFKFTTGEGDYYIDPSAQFIEFAVTDQDTSLSVKNYVLFAVKKYL